MTEAKKDQNHANTLLGVSSADSVTPTPLSVDSATGYLLISMTLDPTLPATLDLPIRRDGNHRPVLCAVTDDAAQDVVPIATDTDGNILIDLI